MDYSQKRKHRNSDAFFFLCERECMRYRVRKPRFAPLHIATAPLCTLLNIALHNAAFCCIFENCPTPRLSTSFEKSRCLFLCWESWILRGIHRAAHYATNHLSVLDASLCVQARSLSLLYESTSSHHKETIILIRKISVLWLFYCKIRVFCPFSLIF